MAIWLLLILVGWGCVQLPALWAMRTRKPANYTDLTDPNQLTDLNNFLSDVFNLSNGRYTLENLTSNPDGTRKGTKGDLVYASYGGQEHLCVNISFPADTDWTCINVGTLSTCPGGADTQIQFNDVGTCGGDTDFTYDKNLNLLTIGDEFFYEDSENRLTVGDVSIQDNNFLQTFRDGIVDIDYNQTSDLEDVYGLYVDIDPKYGYQNDNVFSAYLKGMVNMGTCTVGGQAPMLGVCGFPSRISASSGIDREEITVQVQPTTINLASGVSLSQYRNIWIIDALFTSPSGGPLEHIDVASTVQINGVPVRHASNTLTIDEAYAINVEGNLHSSKTSAALSRWTGTNVFLFEGVTDNNFETMISVQEPTADQTITLPTATGTICLQGPNYNCTLANTTVTGILVVQNSAEVTGQLSVFNNTSLGWSVVLGVNTACNTTCTSACVFGQDTDTANGPIVGCTDASADRCLCAGAN